MATTKINLNGISELDFTNGIASASNVDDVTTITLAALGVTSVGLTAPTEFNVAGSPVTSSGTIALTWTNETANFVFAGPTSGGAATPGFRALVPADIPAITLAGDVTGASNANTVVKLRGASLDTTIGTAGAGQDGYVIYWDNSSSSYKLKLIAAGVTSVSGDGSVYTNSSSTGAVTLTLGTQTAKFVFAGPATGAAATPAFRALVAGDIPALAYVTSVALTAPTEITVSGSPVTSSGTLALTWTNESANKIFAGPASGSATTPSFRSLVAADYPSVVTTSGQGFMISYGILTPWQFSISAAKVTDAGNDVYAWQFVLPCAVTITKCYIQVSTGVNSSTITTAIYSADKSTKLLDSGTFASSVGAVNLLNTVSSVTLLPGVYWFAQSASTATTLTAFVITVNSAMVNILAGLGISIGGVRGGKSNQTAISGVMPATLGTITSDNSVSPIFCAFLPA